MTPEVRGSFFDLESMKIEKLQDLKIEYCMFLQGFLFFVIPGRSLVSEASKWRRGRESRVDE